MLREIAEIIDGRLARWTQRARLLAERLPRGSLELAVAIGFGVLVAQATLKASYLGIAVIVAFLASLALLRKPVWITYLILILAPVHWITLLGERLRVISVLIVLAFGYFTVNSFLGRKPMRDRMVYAYLAFLALCGLSMFKSVDVALSLRYLKTYVFALLFGYVFVLSIDEPRKVRVVVRILLAWGVVLCVWGFLQSFVSPKFYPAYFYHVFGMEVVESYAVAGMNRAAGSFENGPRYAMFMLLPFSLAASFIIGRSAKKSLPWILLLILVILALFVSFTRTAYILAILMVFFLLAYQRSLRRLVKTSFYILLIAVVVAVIVTQVMPENAVLALYDRLEPTGSATYIDRFYFLYNALGAFTENPLLGLGIGTYGIHSWDLMQRFPVPWKSLRWDPTPLSMAEQVPVHNSYGRILAETGIFGILIYVAIFVLTIRNFHYALRHTKDDFLQRVALGFLVYFYAMIIYWFPHEYLIEEAYVSILPVMMSVVLYRVVERERTQEGGADRTLSKTAISSS